MNNSMRVTVSAILSAAVISLLWFVIPATPVWIISYIFALLAIVGIATSFSVYTKKVTRVPQGHSFPIAAAIYAVVSVLFSFVTVSFDINGRSFHSVWYAVIHTAILVFFVIRVIALVAGSEYIEKVGESVKWKHEELNKEKEGYWK